MRCHPRLNSVIYPWCRGPFVRGTGTSTPPKKAETRTCPTPVSCNLTDSVILESYFHFLKLSPASQKKKHSLCELKNLRRSLHSTWNRSGRHFLPYYSSFRFIYLKKAIAMQIPLDPGITYYSCFCLQELKASCAKVLGAPILTGSSNFLDQ